MNYEETFLLFYLRINSNNQEEEKMQQDGR